MEKLTLLYPNGMRGSLQNICTSCTVIDLMDVAEDSRLNIKSLTSSAEAFCKNISSVTKMNWTVDRVRYEYARLKHVDPLGNVLYLRGEWN